MENDSANKQPGENESHKESCTYEDEINLMDYFLVLWKHKWFILVCSVLPTLIVGVCMHLSPRSYVVTYTYDVSGDVRDDVRGYEGDASNWNLNEKNFNILQGRFYGEANIKRIIGNLQQNKLNEYAGQPTNELVKFEVSPRFPDLSRLKMTDPCQFENLRDTKASLLNMTITGKSKEELEKTVLAVRRNFEEVVPLYMVQEQLSTAIRRYNSKLANIESSKYRLELGLKKNNGILAGLKDVNIGTSDNNRTNIVLQFDIGSQKEYLPLNYQIQVAEAKTIELAESIKANEEEYKYYKDLLNLNSRIAAELSGKMSCDYSVKQFRLFLADLVAGYEKPQMKNYLSSYIRGIENGIAISKPISERPKIYPIAKGTAKSSGIVFALALIISVFVSFLLEGLKELRIRLHKS